MPHALQLQGVQAGSECRGFLPGLWAGGELQHHRDPGAGGAVGLSSCVIPGRVWWGSGHVSRILLHDVLGLLYGFDNKIWQAR